MVIHTCAISHIYLEWAVEEKFKGLANSLGLVLLSLIHTGSASRDDLAKMAHQLIEDDKTDTKYNHKTQMLR